MGSTITVGAEVIRIGDAREGYMRHTGIVLAILPADRFYGRRERASVRWRGYRRIGSDYDGYTDTIALTSLVPVSEAAALRRTGPTPTMRRALGEWVRRIGSLEYARPWDVFEERGNQATAMRNSCQKLITDGLLEPEHPHLPTSQRIYRPSDAALALLDVERDVPPARWSEPGELPF